MDSKDLNAEPISAEEWLKRYGGDRVNEDGSLRLALGEEKDQVCYSIPFGSLPTVNVIKQATIDATPERSRMRDNPWPENINTRACVLSVFKTLADNQWKSAKTAWQLGEYMRAVSFITATVSTRCRILWAWVKLGFTKSKVTC
jgi:hypothetical protein